MANRTKPEEKIPEEKPEEKVKAETKTVPVVVAVTTIRYGKKTFKAGEILEGIEEKALEQLLQLKSAKKSVKYIGVETGKK